MWRGVFLKVHIKEICKYVCLYLDEHNINNKASMSNFKNLLHIFTLFEK